MSTETLTTAPPAGTAARGGLTWTVWRVHRSALLVWSAYVLLMVGWMLWLRFVTGPEARAEEAACRKLENGCIDLASAFDYAAAMSTILAAPISRLTAARISAAVGAATQRTPCGTASAVGPLIRTTSAPRRQAAAARA